MHPARKILVGFMEGRPTDAAIVEHIDECEFCRTYCDNYKQLLDSIDCVSNIDQASVDQAAARLFEEAAPAKVISLNRMETHRSLGQRILAADGEQTSSTELQNLATWFSQERISSSV